MTPVRLEPVALRSRVKHSTTEPLRSHRVEGIKVIDNCGTLGELCLHNDNGHQRITKAHIDHSHAIACLERS